MSSLWQAACAVGIFSGCQCEKGERFQINGKTKGTVTIPADITKEDAIEAAKKALGDKLNGVIVKEIYVPGRIINIVQKPAK